MKSAFERTISSQKEKRELKYLRYTFMPRTRKINNKVKVFCFQNSNHKKQYLNLIRYIRNSPWEFISLEFILPLNSESFQRGSPIATLQLSPTRDETWNHIFKQDFSKCLFFISSETPPLASELHLRLLLESRYSPDIVFTWIINVAAYKHLVFVLHPSPPHSQLDSGQLTLDLQRTRHEVWRQQSV